MDEAFDIFRMETPDKIRWIGSAKELAQAKLLAEQAAASRPGNYMIYDHRTGQRTYVQSAPRSSEKLDTT